MVAIDNFLHNVQTCGLGDVVDDKRFPVFLIVAKYNFAKMLGNESVQIFGVGFSEQNFLIRTRCEMVDCVRTVRKKIQRIVVFYVWPKFWFQMIHGNEECQTITFKDKFVWGIYFVLCMQHFLMC